MVRKEGGIPKFAVETVLLLRTRGGVLFVIRVREVVRALKTLRYIVRGIDEVRVTGSILSDINSSRQRFPQNFPQHFFSVHSFFSAQ